jgi:Spy/CpxP family protein refolding chaperone
MNNIKFLKSILLVLLLVNVATISFLWFTKPPKPNLQGSAKGFFAKELSFSAKQEQQFETLQTAFQEQREDLRHEVKDKYDIYFDLLQNPKVDSLTVKKTVSEIIRIKEKEELALFYHFQKVRAICDATQKQKFDKIVKDAAQMMGPRPQEGQRPPPPRREGDVRPPPPPPPGWMYGQGPPPRGERHRPPPPEMMDGQGSPPPPPRMEDGQGPPPRE